MKLLGTVTNRSHAGLFVVLCDANARFGGWDEHGDVLADEGSMEIEVEGLRVFVEENDGRHGGKPALYEGDGVLWLVPAQEPGVTLLPIDRAATEPRTKVVEMGVVDVPSGTLTFALAYPPLNKTTDGDHAGVTHGEGERVDTAVAAGCYAVTREFTDAGQIVALRHT